VARPRAIVSACLLGRCCRWDGSDRRNPAVEAWIRDYDPVLVCPEEAGGLPTPRPPCRLVGGDGHAVLAGRARVLDALGEDRSDAFVVGARHARAAAPDAVVAVLKARSPSCGSGRVEVDGRPSAGDGVLAALLRASGVTLRSEEDLPTPGSGSPAPRPGSAPAA
jgi:uncharacterized protein YbbK (DUF523 family)